LWEIFVHQLGAARGAFASWEMIAQMGKTGARYQ
jgi:hypothetical protein